MEFKPPLTPENVESGLYRNFEKVINDRGF